MMMNDWKIESNPVKQIALMIGCILVGLMLSIGFSDFDASEFSNSLAGFLLGVLLLIIGSYGLLENNRRTVTVNPKSRRIVIEDRSRFKQNRNTIAFEQVADVYVDEMGDTEGGSISYDVVLKLNNGKTISLFRAAIFDGLYDKNIMQNRCRQLQQYLNLSE
jgi:hypothetical protein